MHFLTIGELAKQAGVSRSMLRYYEDQGLLKPAARSRAGYRLYAPEAARTLLFIQRAQRLGFSLADIQFLLDRIDDGALLDETVVALAERRYLELERQLTELLVLRHEMGAFLSDLNARIGEAGREDGAETSRTPASRAIGKDAASHDLFERLVRRVCGHEEPGGGPAREALSWLLDRSGCALAGVDRDRLLAALSGRHIHVWRDDGGYKVLIPGHTLELEAALKTIAGVEADCHAHPVPRLERTDEGFLFTAEGDKAFLFAQFFLDLEAGKPALRP
jgi:MerR family Zn(II)-responsive transcriptional regulator of zntA